MTTLEFIDKQLSKSVLNLNRASQRPTVCEVELQMLKEQVQHYENILNLIHAALQLGGHNG